MAALKDHTVISRMVTDALPKGMERLSQSRFRWDVAGECLAPCSRELEGRPASDWLRRFRYVVVAKRRKHPLIVELSVPCRKCPACLKARRRMWSARALHECRNAYRTWFATFTLRPETHYMMQCRAIAIADSRSIPTKELSDAELALRSEKECAKELTKFFKRIRKQVPQPQVRYLLVTEKHKSGLPHFHALIHEASEVRLTHRLLSSNWQFGFTKFKLIGDVDDDTSAINTARYVAKYLTKSNEGRVRASLGYGRMPTDRLSDSFGSSQSVLHSAGGPDAGGGPNENLTKNDGLPHNKEDQTLFWSNPHDGDELCEQETT